MSIPFLGPVLLAVWQHGPLPEQELLDLVPDVTSGTVSTALAALMQEGLIESCADRHGTLYGPAALCDETVARQAYAQATGASSCQGCGCTAAWPCPESCWWVTSELCSTCAGTRIVA
ncbi:hypothetical protein GO986_20740 [Deinococcus sp. HMF7620]|uniref:Uncharacterized protein n=1 Tax=Deinococcus arboris TaxID=2682977 RepID=A0A7C9HUN3_9DEIO|nr:hypothetical protein [Deinococcus arboris]MVN89167.1 hypothetical protein [Deinococcus arboris]